MAILGRPLRFLLVLHPFSSIKNAREGYANVVNRENFAFGDELLTLRLRPKDIAKRERGLSMTKHLYVVQSRVARQSNTSYLKARTCIISQAPTVNLINTNVIRNAVQKRETKKKK